MTATSNCPNLNQLGYCPAARTPYKSTPFEQNVKIACLVAAAALAVITNPHYFIGFAFAGAATRVYMYYTTNISYREGKDVECSSAGCAQIVPQLTGVSVPSIFTILAATALLMEHMDGVSTPITGAMVGFAVADYFIIPILPAKSALIADA